MDNFRAQATRSGGGKSFNHYLKIALHWGCTPPRSDGSLYGAAPRTTEDRKEATRRLGKRRDAAWNKMLAGLEELAQNGVLARITTIDLVKDNGQEKFKVASHCNSLADCDKDVTAAMSHAGQDLSAPGLAQRFAKVLTKMRRVKDEILKRACHSQAPSRTTQLGSKRQKGTGEAEVNSPVQNAATATAAPAPAAAPAAARAPAAETTGPVAEVSDTEPPARHVIMLDRLLGPVKRL